VSAGVVQSALDQPAALSAAGSGWKVLTHDGCPPIQGGASLLNGSLPRTLEGYAIEVTP
jgi:hypothetical protein